MRRFAFALLVVGALAVGSSARAGGWPSSRWGHGGHVVSAPAPASAPVTPYGGAYGMGAAPAPTYPYSYWAAWPGPAREYVGYGASYGGSDGFAFYGSPYGHANDKWTWQALSGQNALARYYYPPVR
jgi:hypothetical protein